MKPTRAPGCTPTMSHQPMSGEVNYSYNPAPDLAPCPRWSLRPLSGFRRRMAVMPPSTFSQRSLVVPRFGYCQRHHEDVERVRMWSPAIEGTWPPLPYPFGCNQIGHDHAPDPQAAGRAGPPPQCLPLISGAASGLRKPAARSSVRGRVNGRVEPRPRSSSDLPGCGRRSPPAREMLKELAARIKSVQA